jgi:hypothetical protein
MSVVAAAIVGSAVVGAAASNSASKKASAANQASIDANRWQGEIAQDQWSHYKNTYQPLEDDMVKQAQSFDTPLARDQAASEAQATVAEQFGKARDRLSRTPGFDPSTAAATAALSNMDTSQAAVDATSQNAARKGIKDMAWARKMDALGLGKGLVTNASTGMASAGLGAQRLSMMNADNAASTAASVGKVAGNLLSSQGFQNWINTPSVAPANIETPVAVGDAYWKS